MSENLDLELEVSGFQRLVIAQTVYRSDYEVHGGRELSLFYRLGPALELTEMEKYINTDKIEYISADTLKENKKYIISKDLAIYIKRNVCNALSLTSLGAQYFQSLFEQLEKVE